MSYQGTPAERLAGLTLQSGWTVVHRQRRAVDATGGNFSTCYEVEKDGRRAFLKAIDIHGILRAHPDDLMEVMQHVASAYNHERHLLQICVERNLDRIVRTLDTGQERIDATDPTSIVFYFVFELADGDVRASHDGGAGLNVSRIFRTLHDVAIGIQQLHSVQIAHQDLKPSNVLDFPEHRRTVSRIADLGRASTQAADMPHDGRPGAGDPGYWTPEAIYSGRPPEWAGRRACDVYHLGSLLLFLFSGVSTTAAWRAVLPAAYRPAAFGGPYAGSFEDVLPHLRAALQDICQQFPPLGTEGMRNQVVRVFRELCEPDPVLRGHPRNRRSLADQYSVERYIAEFDLLARRSVHLRVGQAA